jgi:hypothetical protein
MLAIDLDRHLEEARREYRAGVLFAGRTTVEARMFYRLLLSLKAAIEDGMVDPMLCLTGEDFDMLCRCIGLNSAQTRLGETLLVEDVVIKPDVPTSLFLGFDADGRDMGIRLIEDDVVAAMA